MATKENGTKCANPKCKLYFTKEFDWQIYGPECEKKALREKSFSKPPQIRTTTNTTVQPLSNQKKKKYRRKIEDTVSEIKRLKANYLLSFRGQYNNLDNDLQKVFNSFRESCDHFSQLLYEKFEGDSHQVKLYFNLNPANKDGMENHCFNSDCQNIWTRVKSQLDLQKMKVIFDIQNKGKHNTNNEVSFEVLNTLKIGKLTVKHKEGGIFDMTDCQVENTISMLNQDYDTEDLIYTAVFPLIGWKREEIESIEYNNIQGSIAGISRNTSNKQAFVKVLNPKDSNLYDVEELLATVEKTIKMLQEESDKL